MQDPLCSPFLGVVQGKVQAFLVDSEGVTEGESVDF